MSGHHGQNDNAEEAPRAWPVPPGFAAAFSAALQRTMPGGVVSSMALWEGKERIGINFKDVADQERVINAVSEALSTIAEKFEYFPGIDISIWRP
jgi:threonine dehydrogenase-like Zn-dependent dehydrogenase